MRISSESVSVRNDVEVQGQRVELKKGQLGSGLKTVLVAMASVAVLSGCLLEGDGAVNKARNEILAANNQGEGGGGDNGSGRGVDGSGGSGSGESGGNEPDTGALVNPSTPSNDRYPGTQSYSKDVDLPSCDAADALRISTPAGLSQINNNSVYRVFCIAPGDYRSADILALDGPGGTDEAPKVIRFESSEFADDDEIFKADLSKLARMPALDIRNTSNWVINRLAWEGTSGMPIRMSGATNIVIDRIRLVNNSRGIEFQHGTHNTYLQNSYIGNQIIPQGTGNDGVCVAMMGNFRQYYRNGNVDYDYNRVSATNNRIVNNEIFNCNDGFQIVWQQYMTHYPDFQGTVIAGNDIYIDDSRRTNCYGSLNSSGDCAYTENAMDFKAASLNPDNPVRVFDNRMWGWRKTDGSYNPPANSWGNAISAHFKPVQNLHIYENVIWDVGAAISLTRGVKESVVRDNIIANVTGAGSNHGIGVSIYSDAEDYNNPTYDSYGNVSDITMEKNHIISTGGAWVSTSAENSTIECNVSKDGAWTATSGPYSNGLTVGKNSYYGTNAGPLSRGTDVVRGSSESGMGQLCMRVKQASVDGGEEVCLDGVLDTDSSPNVCASDYWTTDNWN